MERSLRLSLLLLLVWVSTGQIPPPSFDEGPQVPPPSPDTIFPPPPGPTAPPPAPFPPPDDPDWEFIPPPPAPCNAEDKAALLQIKAALNNSGSLSTWLPDTDCCCFWNYVSCEYATGRVEELSLTGLGLPVNASSPIPPAFAQLQSLVHLDLSGNHFKGPVPDFLGRLPQLRELDLSGNRLSGPIPPSLADSSALQSLQLSGNRLTGVIPSSLFHLRHMDKYQISLDLSRNRLTGPIPASFQGVNFWALSLAGNRLTGDASFVLGRGKILTLLNLSRNRLYFNLSHVEVPPQLSWLNLSHNKIYGGLSPFSIASFHYFNVSYNRLCGEIPLGGSLHKFDQTAYLHNKCLCGAPLPAC